MGHVTKSFTRDHFPGSTLKPFLTRDNFVFLLTWTLFLIITTSGQELELSLQNRVFVALKGENLSISYQLMKPPNLSEDSLFCYNPLHKPIYHSVISATEKEMNDTFILKNMTIPGNYFCQYKTVKAFWFLRVRDSGYKEVWNYTEVIIVSVITGLLLIFSVGGTVYVFRGNWECRKTQSNEGIETQKEKGDSTNDEPAQSSTSFYASLEARPGSVYDVLDHSTAASVVGQRDQTKATTPKKKEAQKAVRDAPQKQEEGIFECVYENF